MRKHYARLGAFFGAYTLSAACRRIQQMANAILADEVLGIVCVVPVITCLSDYAEIGARHELRIHLLMYLKYLYVNYLMDKDTCLHDQ